MKKNKIMLSVGYKVEQDSVRELEKVASDMRTKLGSSLGENENKYLKNMIDEFKRLDEAMEGIEGNEISPKAFDKLNKKVREATENFEKFINQATSDLNLNIDSAALDQLNDQIKDTENLLEELSEKMQLGAKLSTVSGEKSFLKDSMDAKLSKSFTGYTGNTKSLGIEGLHRNRAEFEHVAKAYDDLIKKTEKLKASTKELSESEKAMLSSKNQEKIEALGQTIKSVREEKKAEEEKQRAFKKTHEELSQQLQQQIDKRTELISLSETEEGRILSEASSKASKTKGAILASKTKKDTDLQESEDLRRANNPWGKESESTAQNLVERYLSLTAVLNAVKSIARKTVNTIADLDEAFVSISVVTQYSTKQVWGMYDAFSNIASASGFTVNEIGRVASEYFRQGESFSNVIVLTEAAAKAAKVAGIDAADSVRYLTSAVKGYSLAASEAMTVSDKFAALAASTATNYEGLATAMSKVAAQASANSVEMDNLMGMMATAMEVTQEAPENIGTAFKTILARMSEIKDYGKVLEDGVDANRIERALKTVNVQLFDQNNEMRALDDVLLEVGAGWGSLNRSQKAYIATSLAGTRQQTRLLAVLENMDLTEKNIKASRESAGATEAQQLKNVESLAFQFNRINVAFERFTKNMANSQLLLGFSKTLASTLEVIIGITDTWAGKLATSLALLLSISRVSKSIWASQAFSGQREALLDMVDSLRHVGKEYTDAKVAGLGFGKSLVTMGRGLNIVLSPLAKITIGLALAAAAWKAAKFFSVEKQIERIIERTNELNGKLYDIRQTKGTTDELVKEYKELEEQLIKTNETLERQEEIISLLEDSDVDNLYKFRGSDGGLDLDEVKRRQEDTRKEEEEAFKEKMENNLKLSKKFKDLTSEAEKLYAAEALAMKRISDGVLEEWEKVDEAFKKMAADAAYIELSRGEDLANVYRTADGKYYGGAVSSKENYQIRDGGGMIGETVYTGEGGERLTEGGTISITDIENLDNYKKSIDITKVSMGEYKEALDQLVPEQLRLSDSLYVSAEAMDEMDESVKNLSIEAAGQLDKLFNMMDGHGLDLNKEQKGYFAKIFSQKGANAALKVMEDFYTKAEGANTTFASALIQSRELFEEINLDKLLDSVKTFESLSTTIDTANNALKNFNSESLELTLELMDRYKEFPEVIEDMTNSIVEHGQIDESVKRRMVEVEKERVMSDIKTQIEQTKAKALILEEEIKMFEEMKNDEVALGKIAANGNIDISGWTGVEISKHLNKLSSKYGEFHKKIVSEAAKAGILYQENLLFGAGKHFTPEKDLELISFKGANQEAMDKRLIHLQNQLNETIKDKKSELNKYNQEMAILDATLKAIESNKFNEGFDAAGKSAEKAAKATAGATKEVEYYISALNKLYVAQKRLEVVNWAEDLLDAKAAYVDSANAVQGLAGAVEDLSDQSAGEILQDQYGVLGTKIKEMKNLISVSKEYQDALISGLDPALKGTYEIIGGRVIPITEKFSKLNGDQMKELDEMADKFNGLTSEIEGYTNQMYEAGAAQNAIIEKMRDRVIEYHELMLATIKNEEKKQIDSFKKIIDANKEYLNERKKLYEEAFKEEDKEKESEEIQEERTLIIEKLSALESAHDLTSIQKREAYRKQLQDLNEAYNNIALERNREAMLESIDEQIEYQDETYQKEEEFYNERIASGEWLEARMKQIQDEARVQALIDLDLHGWTIQQLLDSGYITQEEITRAGIEDMNMTVEELSDEQLGIFKKYWGANRDVIDKMWNESEVGAKALSEKAMDYILKYLVDHSEEMEGKTEMMKEKVLGEWKDLLEDVADYTKEFNATELEGPDTQDVTNVLDKLLKDIGETADDAQLEYKRIIDGANAAKSAAEAAKRAIDNYNRTPLEDKNNTGTTYRRIVTEGGNIANRHGVFKDGKSYNDWVKNNAAGKNPGSYSPMATGGTTERTGLHWLDGKPGAPERVLSPGQNREFENLLRSLTQGQSQPNDNSDVVESLMSVVKAVYDSSYESSEAITEAISKLDIKDGGVDIKSIARNHGISTNRRGDR